MNEPGIGNEQEVFGGLGEVDTEIKNIESKPLTGDWEIIERLQIKRPESYVDVTKNDGIDLLEKAALALRRVAGMKEDLREKCDEMSEKYIKLIASVKNNEIPIAEALKQLDGEEATGDKIRKL